MEDQQIVLKLHDEVVCRVNTEAISKREVEEHMGIIPAKIEAMRESLERAGQLTKENEEKLDETYREPFRDALRGVVKEKLMLQAARLEKVTIDEKQFQKRYEAMIERVRADGALGGAGMTPGEISKRMRDRMLMDNFASRFYTILDQPSRPEVQKYYQDNIEKYQRKAGVKVRVIRVDRIVTNKLTQQTTVRENALELAEEWRKDIDEYGGDFKEMAKEHSDDPESRKRGGLIQLDPKDPFIDPNSYSPQLAAAIRDLEPGKVSKVFEFGKSSWAFAMVEARREAGPAPLEGELFQDIFTELLEKKSKKQENEWFRKQLSKSLVVHVIEGNPKPLPLEFFFPDDAKAKTVTAAKPADAPKAPANDEKADSQ
jgi:hypothetical protein